MFVRQMLAVENENEQNLGKKTSVFGKTMTGNSRSASLASAPAESAWSVSTRAGNSASSTRAHPAPSTTKAGTRSLLPPPLAARHRRRRPPFCAQAPNARPHKSPHAPTRPPRRRRGRTRRRCRSWAYRSRTPGPSRGSAQPTCAPRR